jgi:nicotinamide mononucleotide transporter
MSQIEITAVIFGLFAVWFTVRQNIWCWPMGLVQVSLYVIVFYQVKLYSDLILHVIYVGVQLFGWYHWLHGGRDHGKLTVSYLKPLQIGAWILVVAAGTALWGKLMGTLTDAAVPYGDAFTTTASLVAMWLQVQKKVESWAFWIAVDVVAIAIYSYKELYPTTGLYVVFMVLSIMGWRQWRASYRASALESAPNAAPG